MKLNNKIVSGLGWTSFATFGTQALRLIFKLILAQLLLPEHYGIIGMATVFISFIESVSELGMNSALIQKKEEHMKQSYYDTAFWSNLILSSIGYIAIVLAVAPFAAWFYEEDILLKLIPVVGVSIIINSLYVIPKVILTRKMSFKPQAFIEISAAVSAGIVAITLAYMGYGVWALAFNGILISIASTILYFFKVRWIPEFQFDVTAFKDLFGFGSKVLVENIFAFFTLNIDYILIGKLIGGAALGAYTLAFILTSTFMKQVVKIINKVLYPAYSAIQDSAEKIGHYYLRLAKLNNLLMAPVMLIFIVLGDAVIYVGFGEEWVEAIFPLRVLALAVIISSIGGSSSIVMRSMGRPDLSMKLNMLCTSFSTVPAVIIGSTLYGIRGAAIGILADRVIRFVLYQQQVKKLTGVTILDLVKQVAGTLFMCLLIGVLIFYLKTTFSPPHKVALIMGGTIAVLLYALYLYLFERKIINKVLEVTKIKEKVRVHFFNLI